jgi:hypothetical protein
LPDDNIPEDDREILNQMQKVVLQAIDEDDFTYLYLDANGVALRSVS